VEPPDSGADNILLGFKSRYAEETLGLVRLGHSGPGSQRFWPKKFGPSKNDSGYKVLFGWAGPSKNPGHSSSPTGGNNPLCWPSRKNPCERAHDLSWRRGRESGGGWPNRRRRGRRKRRGLARSRWQYSGAVLSGTAFFLPPFSLACMLLFAIDHATRTESKMDELAELEEDLPHARTLQPLPRASARFHAGVRLTSPRSQVNQHAATVVFCPGTGCCFGIRSPLHVLLFASTAHTLLVKLSWFCSGGLIGILPFGVLDLFVSYPCRFCSLFSSPFKLSYSKEKRKVLECLGRKEKTSFCRTG
jgi:hypothetical protein